MKKIVFFLLSKNIVEEIRKMTKKFDNFKYIVVTSIIQKSLLDFEKKKVLYESL